MDWNWLFGLIYGTIGGFFEFLPVSPLLHQKVLLKLTGLDAPGYGMSLAVHLGAFVAVLLSYYSSITKMNRERKIAGQSKRSRKRQPDVVSLMQLQLLKVAAIPVILSCLVSPWLSSHFDRLWLMALFAILCGVVVMLPHYMAQANKDARSLSPLDATLIGFSGILGALPGFSKVGTMTAVASMRGAERRFSLDFAYLLLIPAMAALCVGDLAMIVIAGDPQAGPLFIPGVLACLASCGMGFVSIRLMQFLAVKVGYESLTYYNWGLAMFTFVIYLIG